jgi:hypothetical protein
MQYATERASCQRADNGMGEDHIMALAGHPDARQGAWRLGRKEGCRGDPAGRPYYGSGGGFRLDLQTSMVYSVIK